MRAFAEDRIEVVVSPALLAELEQVLQRRKFRRYVDGRTAREYVERVRRHATVADDPADRPALTRDPEDDYLVALARDAQVDALVSGDLDLVEAGLKAPAVWTPRELVKRLRGG